jgi:hypothetical protein
MKRVVVSALLAVCLAQPAAQAVAQTVSDQCFALGDIAGQVASWRAHKKTKAQALDQAAKYYKDSADRQAVSAIIEKIYAPDAPTRRAWQCRRTASSSRKGKLPRNDACGECWLARRRTLSRPRPLAND